LKCSKFSFGKTQREGNIGNKIPIEVMVEKLVDDEGKKIEECSYSWEKAMRELEVVIVKDWMMEQGNEREVIFQEV
jgi:hypothetical protein